MVSLVDVSAHADPTGGRGVALRIELLTTTKTPLTTCESKMSTDEYRL